eukprot:TRINITY_DN83651_c0_g1_i4.p1 TRINITY_DN83651_c0_g1~~TRINITY_DN83651_c0_g1_i4.p1  ORF type:complete len:168 (-),score=12.88 TRINITY_DN83651_c0_g1_i4:238-741(-)
MSLIMNSFVTNGQIKGSHVPIKTNTRHYLKRRFFGRRAVEEEITPSLQRPTLNRPVIKPETEEQIESSSETAVPTPPTRTPQKSVVTIEFQRRMAKEMTNYFKSQQEKEVISKSQVFGWTAGNEINNGRWVMMGLAIGLLTEYSTGVNFIDQLKLMISYLGIADIYD